MASKLFDISALAKGSVDSAVKSGEASDVYFTSETHDSFFMNLENLLSKGVEKLSNQRFIVVKTGVNEREYLFDSVTKLLWQRSHIGEACSLNVADAKLRDKNHILPGNWELPKSDNLARLASNIGNGTLRHGVTVTDLYFHTAEGSVRIYGDTGVKKYGGTDKGYVLGVHTFFAGNEVFGSSDKHLLKLALDNCWQLFSLRGDSLLFPLGDELFEELDLFSARLPKIDKTYFTDPSKGIWEFWNTDIPGKFNVRARNPADDIRPYNVAIDFGTSSTVVAIEENGQGKLLRIGVKDFHSEPESKHYENPTILELVNLKDTLAAWQSQAYRPAVGWDDVRCSHEALHNFRHNEANPKMVGSILAKIKQWALREASGEQVRLTDQENSEEHLLAPLTLRQTVKGQPIVVSEEDPFDPLELYAWFLGLNINWRGRGIFLNYYMSFPVAYPKEVKDKILASFRRGLQRSLPLTLVDQPKFADFSVEERASEPAAYAAAAMDQLEIKPTEKGVAYAVFDFGGGTADFDFGYYRLPTDEEDDEGFEQVFEHVGASGDKFLGGENLLENMAYRVFLENLDICREEKIAFTRPLDAEDFPGSEMFLDRTQAAHTNTIMMMARLRPIWEQGTANNSSGIEKLELLDREGSKVSCEFSVDEENLLEYLEERIEEGIQNFYVALHKYFGDKPNTVHVLLAGNSSRSKWVSDFFGLNFHEGDEEDDARYIRMNDWLISLYNGDAPDIEPYDPLPEDKENIYSPTAKTGVALGLLNLCPGSATKVINRTKEQSNDDAPFHFYVGRIQRRQFKPGLLQGAAYNEYVELGPIRERVFQLVHSQSPRAHTGTMPVGDTELHIQKLAFAGNTDGHKLFAKIKGPATIEICTAGNLEDIVGQRAENQREIVLH